MKEIAIQLKPITVNQCWKGRKFKTKEYETWRVAAYWLLKKFATKDPIEWCEVEINIYIKHYATTDADNANKPILDALTEAEIIKDDRYVKSVKITKHESSNERIEINIKPI